MVMCGYLVDSSRVEKLREAGVKDSKLLTAEKRRKIGKKIKNIADSFKVVTISASEIDSLRTITNLNKIEIARMQDIINELRPDRVVVDACEANTKRFGMKIKQKLANKDVEIISENFADRNYPEVSAASIIAKLHRDAEIAKLHRIHGHFGSGYPSDERTINFLKDWIKMNKEFPDCVRKSWITSVMIKNEKEQKKIRDFGLMECQN
jgi:ribonuclease HII